MELPGLVFRCHGIPFFHFYFILYFLFRNNSEKNTWMWRIFVTVMVIISKVPFWKLRDINSFQISQQLRGLLTTTFKRHLFLEKDTFFRHVFLERFYRHGSTYVLIFSWVNIMKRKWPKIPWKLLVAQKSEPVLWRTFARHFTYYNILLFLWNKPSFSIEPRVDRTIFTELCSSFTFWYSVHILEFIQYLLSLFYKSE